MTEKSPAPRVVLAKIGLDGHDRGVKVVARGLRDSGFHVIYAGLWQPIEAVVQTALDEDADWLGISLLSGAHMALVPPLMKQLREKGLEDVGVLVGGIIPEADIPKLEALGVRAIFGPGTTIPEIVGFMKKEKAEPATDDLVRRFRDKDRRAGPTADDGVPRPIDRNGRRGDFDTKGKGSRGRLHGERRRR